MLDNNGIEKIPSALFSSFSELRTLSLKRNTIVAVDDNCFLSLTKLNKLWLSNNNLVYCTNPLHTGLTSALTDLDISGNLIRRIDPECIDGLDQLRQVYLENNKLGSSGLLKNSFTGRDIITIEFSRNRLTVLANDTLNNMTSLQALSLHDNDINKVETGCFQGLTSLFKLNLANNDNLGNHIDDLQIALSNVPELGNLELSSCGITRLPIALLHTLTKLDNLGLTNNAIISWEPEFFLGQKSLTSFGIYAEIRLLRSTPRLCNTYQRCARSTLMQTLSVALVISGNFVTGYLAADFMSISTFMTINPMPVHHHPRSKESHF